MESVDAVPRVAKMVVLDSLKKHASQRNFFIYTKKYILKFEIFLPKL